MVEGVADITEWYHRRSNSMRPLDGITVITLEHAISAPLATRHLADLGARVIKIERPGHGWISSRVTTRRSSGGMASYFVWVNRGKESLTLDLKHPEAEPILMGLAAKADVVIQNLAPGAGARLGYSEEALRPLHPRLIVCDISGYGLDGPYRDKKAYDILIQAEAGLLSVTGTPEQPSRTGIPIADIASGMYAYSKILAAQVPTSRNHRPCAVTLTSPCSKRWASGCIIRFKLLPWTARRRRKERALGAITDCSVRSVPRRGWKDGIAGHSE